MKGLTLPAALSVALAVPASERPVGIATVVASTSLSASVGMRAVFSIRGMVTGSLGRELDRMMETESPAMLSPLESSMYSYVFTNEGAERTRIGTGDLDLYVEILAASPALIIVGAGHIAVPLAAMAKIAGFEVTVVDDRPEYGNRDRFPTADRVCLGEYRETVASIPIDSNTYVVLVTRGHVHDQACLEQVLQFPAAYIGMIGSKKRVRTVAQHAVEAGASADRVKTIYAPIGLDLGARTPAEIAVAILAEMIAVRRGRAAHSLALKERLGV